MDAEGLKVLGAGLAIGLGLIGLITCQLLTIIFLLNEL